MGLTEGHQAKTVWENPAEIVRSLHPENPVMVFAPTVLQDRARAFLAGFPGLVTYAVKSNPDEAVIQNLVQAGIRGFDVASPFEIDLIGRLAPTPARHYHNPVRSRAEIAHAVGAGRGEIGEELLERLHDLGRLRPVGARADTEVDVRLRDAELPEEDVGHLVVVVLTGVDEQLLDVVRAEPLEDGRRLGEVGASTGHVQNKRRHGSFSLDGSGTVETLGPQTVSHGAPAPTRHEA